MFRIGFSIGARYRKCGYEELIYLTDEAGNRLLDPAGNLIVYG